MSNIINDKLLSSNNFQFMPGEETSLMAYMQGKVGKFKVINTNTNATMEFKFIVGQTFSAAMNAGLNGVNVCRQMGLFMEEDQNDHKIYDRSDFGERVLCYDSGGKEWVIASDTIEPITYYWYPFED